MLRSPMAQALPRDVETLTALLLKERAEHATAVAAKDHAHAEIERLHQIIKELQRHRFGRRAETLDPDQLALGLEDVEQEIAAGEAGAESVAPAAKAAAHPSSFSCTIAGPTAIRRHDRERQTTGRPAFQARRQKTFHGQARRPEGRGQASAARQEGDPRGRAKGAAGRAHRRGLGCGLQR